MAGLAAAYELQRRGRRFVCSSAGSRAGGVILSEEVDGYTIDAGPDSLLVQKPRRRSRSARSSASATAWSPRSRRASPSFSAAASCIRCRPRRCSAFRRAWDRSPDAPVLLGRQAAHGRRAVRAAAARRRRRVDRRVHAAAVRRRRRRHISPSRCSPAFTPATSIACRSGRCFRGSPRPSARTAACSRAFRRAAPSGRSSSDGAFRSLPGGLSEMVRALVARAAAGVACASSTPVSRVSRDRRAVHACETGGRRSLSRRAPSCSRRRHTSTGRLVARPRRRARAACAARSRTRPRRRRARVSARRGAASAERLGVRRAARRKDAASWRRRGCRRSGRTGRRTVHVLLRTFVGGSARSARARAIGRRARRAIARGASAAARHHAASRCSRASIAWSAPARSTRSATSPASRRIERALAQHPGLFITGSGFRGVGIPDCVADGRATARQACEWLQHDRQQRRAVR